MCSNSVEIDVLRHLLEMISLCAITGQENSLQYLNTKYLLSEARCFKFKVKIPGRNDKLVMNKTEKNFYINILAEGNVFFS